MPAHDEPDIDDSPHIEPPGYLTADIAGIGGTLRQRVEDFIVEEVPAYMPCGEGEHVYLFLQKYNLTTSQLVSIVARHFRVRESDVGYAGLKDKRAVTRQVMSIHVPGKKIEDFPSLQHERVQVLWADMHTNKLRRGHLKANRFAIKVRGVEVSATLRAANVLRTLESAGVPNRAGEQRFGFFANNHVVGRLLILGDEQGVLDELLAPKPLEMYPSGHADPEQVQAREAYVRRDYAAAMRLMPPGAETEVQVLRALSKGATTRQAVRSISPTQRGFFLSAIQSAVFNAVLDRRMVEGTFATLVEGDLAMKHDNGSVFAVDTAVAADVETARRLKAIEISPTGPNWGTRMMRATGVPAQVELDALHAAGLSETALGTFVARDRDVLDGARRALRVPLMYADVEGGIDEHGVFIRCSFELPPGAFATTVMREVMKPTAKSATVEETTPTDAAASPPIASRIGTAADLRFVE